MTAEISSIETWLYTQLSTDSTLLAAIGGSTSAPRIYYYYPPVEEWGLIDEYQGALIAYRLGSSGGQGGDVIWALQEPDEVGMIDIYGYKRSVVESAFNIIDILFDENLQASITGWKVRRIHRINKVDMYEPASHFYHKHIEYRFSGLLDAS